MIITLVQRLKKYLVETQMYQMTIKSELISTHCFSKETKLVKKINMFLSIFFQPEVFSFTIQACYCFTQLKACFNRKKRERLTTFRLQIIMVKVTIPQKKLGPIMLSIFFFKSSYLFILIKLKCQIKTKMLGYHSLLQTIEILQSQKSYLNLKI